MPNTIRCAASAGRGWPPRSARRPPCARRAANRWPPRRPPSRGSPAGSRAGPDMCGGKRTDSSSASDTGTATMKMTAAAPVSSAPNSQRGSSMKLAPRNAAAAPVAVATAFIVTTCSRGTTCGSAADRPDETNRVKPLTINAPNRIGRSLGAARRAARPTPTTSTSRPRFAPTSTSRRSQRSSSAPGERPQQRVRQEQHGERTGDLPRAGGAFGIEQQRARQPGLEQAVTELARRPQFEQSPEFGQAAHRPPKGHRCATRQPREFTVQISRRTVLVRHLDRSLVT